MGTIWVQILGILYLIFRLWIVEFRLRSVLGNEIRYFSRFIAYYLGLNMTFNLAIMSINAILITSVASFSIITILTDFTFAARIKKQYPGQTPKTYLWLFLERFTLHLPVLAVGFWMIADGFLNHINLSMGIFPIIFGALLFYIPFLFFDARWKKKEVWPLGPIIFSFSIAQFIGLVVTFLVI